MDSFTVQCTSCQSRIRVRNPKLVGQIAQCPKCGSMIMISAPQRILVESGNATDSVAVTREALPQPAEDVLNNWNALEQPFRSDGLPEPPDAPPLPELNDQEFLDLAPAAMMAEPAPPPRTAEVSAASSIEAIKAKRQESITRQRQIMLVVAIGFCSVLLASGILFAFLSWFAPPKPVAKNQPGAGHASKPVDDSAKKPTCIPSTHRHQRSEPCGRCQQSARQPTTNQLRPITQPAERIGCGQQLGCASR